MVSPLAPTYRCQRFVKLTSKHLSKLRPGLPRLFDPSLLNGLYPWISPSPARSTASSDSLIPMYSSLTILSLRSCSTFLLGLAFMVFPVTIDLLVWYVKIQSLTCLAILLKNTGLLVDGRFSSSHQVIRISHEHKTNVSKPLIKNIRYR